MLNLDAQAARAGQRRVYLRTATHEGRIYISLCDDARRVVEVDSEGWRILNDPPEVRFRRTRTAKPLPEPVGGDPRENIGVLRRFLNVEERDFVLCVAWLLAALRDTGPYPLLVLTGEQGSAKSTAAKLLRSLVDPVRPGSERDAAIAARNGHVLIYDNLSGLPAWFSDTLCRLSTGEGYATRRLYTDYEEAVIEASRPVILNGIENPSVRGDLAERSITIRLAPIAAEARLTESALMTTFEEAAPSILGSLLTGLYGRTTMSGSKSCPVWPTSASGLSPAGLPTGVRAPSWRHTTMPRHLPRRMFLRTPPSARPCASSSRGTQVSSELRPNC